MHFKKWLLNVLNTVAIIINIFLSYRCEMMEKFTRCSSGTGGYEGGAGPSYWRKERAPVGLGMAMARRSGGHYFPAGCSLAETIQLCRVIDQNASASRFVPGPFAKQVEEQFVVRQG